MDNISILQKAVMSNDLGILNQTLSTLNRKNIIWGNGINVLHYFITKANKLTLDYHKAIDVFIQNGIDINSQDEEGVSVLHYCVAYKNANLAKVIIEKGANVDIKNSKGNTPLWRGVMDYRGEKELLDVIRVLVNSGASPDIENNSGFSPRKIVLRRHDNIAGQPKEWDLQPLLNW